MNCRSDLLINGFNHCGHFLLKNTTTAADFQMATSFEHQHEGIIHESPPPPHDLSLDDQRPTTSAELTAARCVLSSPKKQSNPAHTRPHTAVVSAPDFLQHVRNKRTKRTETKPKSKPKPKPNRCETDDVVCVVTVGQNKR